MGARHKSPGPWSKTLRYAPAAASCGICTSTASRLREEQARNTRVRIIEAAEHLFVVHGYPATTIDAIASAAGVAVDTVYATLGSKRGILSSLLGMRLGGDVQPVSILDRPAPQAMRQEPDQRRQLAMFAAASLAARALRAMARGDGDPDLLPDPDS